MHVLCHELWKLCSLPQILRHLKLKIGWIGCTSLNYYLVLTVTLEVEVEQKTLEIEFSTLVL